MFSLDLLLEVIMQAFYENMRKWILQKINIPANSSCWIWAGGLDSERKYGRICYRHSLWGLKKGECQPRGIHGFPQRNGEQISD